METCFTVFLTRNLPPKHTFSPYQKQDPIKCTSLIVSQLQVVQRANFSFTTVAVFARVGRASCHRYKLKYVGTLHFVASDFSHFPAATRSDPVCAKVARAGNSTLDVSHWENVNCQQGTRKPSEALKMRLIGLARRI
jgi:hypothetical protein